MARRHESLIPLSHEHHDALLLAWRLRTGDLFVLAQNRLKPAEMAELGRQIKAQLR